MTPTRLAARILVAACAAAAPLWAQTPLFTDGGALGGSKVFSEGMNPLGNPARFDQAPAGYYFSFAAGDEAASNLKSNLSNQMSSDPTAVAATMTQLGNGPWAQRTTAYGFAAIKNAYNLGLSRELLNGIVAHPDLADPSQSYLDGRRAVVDRLNLGGGSAVQAGTSFGMNVRVESWAMGMTERGYGTPIPYQFGNGDAYDDLLGSTGTSDHALNFGIDLGGVFELAQGVRLGVTVDQLLAKHLWDINLQPQYRAGLQIDLGAAMKLDMESDLNSVERMPFPVKQMSSGASLRITTSPAVVFLLGVQQRKVDLASVTSCGATLQLRMSSMLVSLGFQVSQGQPVKSATFMVN